MATVPLGELWKRSRFTGRTDYRTDEINYASNALEFIESKMNELPNTLMVHGGFVRRLISVLFSESEMTRMVNEDDRLRSKKSLHEPLDHDVDIDFVCIKSITSAKLQSLFQGCHSFGRDLEKTRKVFRASFLGRRHSLDLLYPEN